MNRFSRVTFKLLDLMVMFVMIFSSPMSAFAQDNGPTLMTDKTDYVPSDTVHVSGVGFAMGTYSLKAAYPDGSSADWGPVVVDETLVFYAAAGVIAEGSYELAAYAEGSDTAVANATFAVVAPPPPPAEPAPAPSIQSDKADYAPGELVTITGGNWQGDTQVRIFVNDDLGQTWSRDVVVDVAADGTIVDSFNLPAWFVATYKVVASGQETGRAVTTSFTDLSIGTYDQCSNDKGVGYSTDDTGCRWINGNLQSNNSYYAEGDATVQRVWLTGFVPGSTHTLTLQYGTTKGGTHAYDFLTTWDWSEDWILEADRCQGITGCVGLAESKLDIPQDPSVPNSFEPSAPGDRQFTMRGGTLNSATTPVIESGSYAGDSETILTINFTVASSGSMCDAGTCGVALWFGAHVSAQANWGLGQGAGSISGSPYHVALYRVDGASVGKRDNQMQASAVTVIPNGTIVIVKDAVPNDAQDFNFNINNNSTINQNFSLDDDSDATLPNSQTFSVPPGMWYAKELMPLPTGWSLTNLVCVDPTSNTTVDLATGTATINLASNETVTCTYTDTKAGHIIVKKVTSSGDYSFEFDPSWSTTNFFLSNGQTNDSGPLSAGTYSVAEVNIPSTWSLTSATCDDGSPVTAIALAEGETVTCTFTNTRVYNQDLTVTKTAEESFGRTYTWDIYKNVDKTTAYIADGGSATFNYTVGVTHDNGTDSGWVVSGVITVHNPNSFDIAGVDLTDAAPGGTCTVTNGAGLTVPAGGDKTANYSCTFASNPGSGTNTATATWNATTYNTPTGTASGTAGFDFAGVTPSITNTSVTVTDTLGGNLGTVSYTDPSPKEFTYSYTFSGVAGTCTKYDNTATINENGKFAKKTVEVCVGKDLTVTKTADPFFTRTWDWTITKDVDGAKKFTAGGGPATFNYTVGITHDAGTDSAWTVTGTIKVSNPNAWEDIITTVTDAAPGGTCTVTGGENVKVLAGKSVELPYTCTFTSGASGINTATATWDKDTYSTPTGSATGTADYAFVTPTTIVDGSVTVSDTMGGDLGTVSYTDPSPTEFKYSKTFNDPAGACTSHENIATFTTNTTGTTGSASKTVTDCQGADLIVTKTAVPTFTRTWDWTITKDFDATYNLFAGESVTHGYKVTVTPNATDSAWQVVGTITIVNPNDWEDIMLTGLSDVADGGTCTVDPTLPIVPKGGSVDVNYSCTWATQPLSYSGTNTATATWDKATAFTPNGSASGSKDYEFTNPSEINPTVTVDDNNLTGEAWSATRKSETWTYSKNFSCSSNPEDYIGDGKYDYSLTNIATIKETTGDSDTATVTVNCYAPVVSKTAVGTYDERYEWAVEKTVAPVLQSAFIGDTVSYEWTVVVTETVTEETFKVAGEITVVNPAPMEMTVDLFDELGGGTDAVIGACTNGTYADGKLTIPANTTATCAYTAEPGGRTDTVNNVTATLNGIAFSASKDFTWTANVIRGSATLDDDQNPAFPKTLTDGDTFKYTEQYTCSTDKTQYDATSHKYTFPDSNTATLTSGDFTDTSTASTTVNCYVPTISKTANGTYDEVHDWEVFKTGAAAQKKFAGQSASFSWTVRVDETTHGENYLVTGDIVVTNPNPEDALTISLNDVLDDGSVATIGPCTGGIWSSPNLTVPAGGTATCDYTVTPKGDLADFANALPAQVTMKVDYPERGDPAYFEAVTITGNGALNGVYEGWCIDQDHTIAQNTNYTANVFSSYEALPAGLVEHPENFDLVNWIINQDYVYKPAGGSLGNYTYGDVQRAIWELIDDTPFITNGLDLWNQTRVNQIKAAAIANGEGFTPTCGDYVAVILQPIDVTPPTTDIYQAITIAQVTFASLGVDCAESNAVTAVYKGIEFPASAEISWTANPVNATATLDDTQNPAWPITVSADQTFTYTDPEGYVCPSDPAAYAGDGIAPVYTDSNTATITYVGGSKSSTASTSVTCYGPIVSKTAAAEWRKKYDWTITKTADPTSHIGFAGDSFTSAYDVFVDQTITDYGFLASGTISVKNPSGSPGSMTVNVADMVSGGFVATVDCDPLTTGNQTSVVVAANTTKTCTYTASLSDNTSRVNTATGTFNGIGFPATANVTFGAPIIEGYPTINVTDSVQGELGSATEDKHFTYTDNFSCSTNAADYTNYADSDTYGNIAKITETNQTDDASVKVDCYIPEISKTASGAYGERHEWDVEKTVTPASQDAFAGASVSYEWKVVVTEEVFEEGFVVSGKITVVNHNPEDAMTVTLSDVLSDNAAASITTCEGDEDLTDGLTIAAGGSSVCNYSATLAYTKLADAPTNNTATAVLNTLSYTASDTIEWTPSITGASATVTDDQIGLNQIITNGNTFTGSETYTCSSTASDYTGDGNTTFSESNTAKVVYDLTTKTDSATETINCYAPVISKTAAGTYDERHEWDVEKTVNPASQSGFAGDTLPFTWTITVTESVFEENFDVAGAITVVNPAPMAMTVALTDVLSDSTAVVIGACTNDATYADGSLTIPANTTTVCSYTAIDLAYIDDVAAPTGNTATATLNGIAFVATDPIEYAVNVIRGEAELTDLQGPLSETITGSGSWTVVDSYTCSVDKTKYTTNYNYTETILNTATVTSEEEEQDSDTTSTAITCVIPEISKTAAGAYDERHEWDVEKTVSPVSQSAFAGDTVSYEWTVKVIESVFEENFVASGQITIVNHNAEDAMTVALSDVLNGTTATITACTGDANLSDGLTIAVGGTSVCDYTAALDYEAIADAPTNNTATAVLNGISYSASDPIEWTANVIRGSVSLDDDQNPGLPGTISNGGTWNYTEQYTCSTTKTEYNSETHKYTFGESNTATVKEGETLLDSSTASNTIDCYVPTISKNANGTYDEVHDWEVFKSVDIASQTAFAGERKNFTWTVRVDETTHGESYLVTGKITVVNPNPEDVLTVALSDALNDGSIATIGPCTGGTWSSPNLTVPAGGTATCDYTVTPKGNMAKFAAALPATVTINSANPGPDSYWLTTVSNDAALNGVYEAWCVDIDHTMNPGVNYTAAVYSSYEAYPSGLIEKAYDMDLVNWIINQDFVGKSAAPLAGNYTYGDVQRAIWEIIEDNPTATTAGLGTWNQARVDQLEALARASGQGFVPGCGDFVAVLLVPTGGQQPIAIAQVTFASLGLPCAESNNVKATLNGVEYPASADISWNVNKINETASLDDDQRLDWPTTVSADTTFTYQDPQGYNCSSNPADYANGFYQYNESNTAVLTFGTGSDTATASTAVKCYAPVVSKTAAGAYDERHEWDVEKSVTPLSQDVLAGQTGNFTWTVTVTESVFEENFVASGTISVRNPRPDNGNMTVKLTDMLSDGFVPTITGCTGGTWNATNKTVAVPPNTTAVCSYTASLVYNDDALAPTNNTATAELMVGTTHFTTTASDAVEWGKTVIRGSATLDDTYNPAWTTPITITDGGTFTYSTSEACSTTQSVYNTTTGTYTFTKSNTATVTTTDYSRNSTAESTVTCYAPVVTKDVTTYWNRDWDWTITKVEDATYNLFAGSSVTHNYKVTVDPTYTDNFWGVKGTITIANPHPTENMLLFSLSDIAGGITGEITCPNPILTIPANDSITCTYDTGAQDSPNAEPFGDLNTATAVFAGANWTGTAAIAFSTTPSTENEPVITVDDDNLDDEVWTATRAKGEWTYTKDFACSADPAKYTDGKYSYELTNTATINETGQKDTAKVDVNCYAPKVVKDATTYFNRDWDWTIVKDYDASYNLFAGDTVTHGYKVTVDPTYEDNFWGVKGSITVYNYHPTEVMTLTSLTDLAGGITGNVTCDSLVVPAAGSLTCTYDTGKQTAPNANPFGALNTATATFAATDWTGTAPIVFSATPTTEDEPVITVDDDNLTGESWTADRAAAKWTYTKDFACSTNPDDYKDGGKYSYSLTNTAKINETGQTDTAKVEVNCYAPLVSKTAAGTYDERHEWDVTKTVTPASQNIFASATADFNWTVKVKEVVVEENFVVKGVITVINPAPMPMVANLTDVLGDGTAVTITPTAGCAYVNGTLTIPANSTANCDYSAKLSYTDDADAAKSNTGEVTLNGLTIPATASIAWTANIIRPEASLTDDQKPLNELLKSAGPFPGTFDYEFTYADSYTCSSDVSKYNASGTYKETINNTATVVSGDKTNSSTASTSVNCYIPTVSKTASPTFTRTFLWDISKSVDKTLVKQVGGSAVFNYTVTVNETGYTDSLWKVTGKITIVNPNPSAPITVNVTDAVNNGGICTVASGTNVTVGAGQSSVFDYTCGFAEKPTSYQGVNTVTAEWISASTASQFVSNTAAFAFDTGLTGNPTNVNKTITVTDTFNGSTTTLGTVTATTSIPYTSKTFTYSRTIAIPTYNCKTYPNTAKIVETNQIASQTIKVCGPMNLGGKTIGFWQNKNGQDIIKKAGVITGTTTCKLTPWLRGFAPFQDLNASASCTTVAAYTTNIIKAANASGASMNAMLKAQMLATALDVYFSDPLLGGNKIGALAPIGGQTIDLTKVKAGTGYQNVSGAFGGATSMTVSQMLAYAASQSNVGGTTWYSNVKTTQENAKNAFDAINNNWVFAP